MRHYLQPLFAPRSVAVIGASPRPTSIGQAVLRNIIDGGYRGAVHAINPKYTSIGGMPCRARIKDIGQPVDLSVIVTPASTVPRLLHEVAEAGGRDAMVLSAGFADAGAAGRALCDELRLTASELGVRVLGPNCLGLMRPGMGLNATFARGGAQPGKIALVSQSGAICSALTDWAQATGIGFSSVISLGEAIDIDFGEILDYLGQDEETHSILLYIEGIRDARRFISALRATARSKPVVVLKAGRGFAGAHAATSHSGALTGSDAVFDAALRRCGVVRVDTYSELFAVARLLSAGRFPRGRRLAIMSNGGGAAVIAADCASARGIELAQLRKATLEALDRALPVHWSHGDPVDIIGDAPVDRFQSALKALLADPETDGVLTLFCPQVVTPAIDAAKAIVPIAAEAPKPVLTAWLGGTDAGEGRAYVESAGIAAFSSPEAGVLGFAALAKHVQAQRLLLQAPPSHPHDSKADVGTAWDLARSVASQNRSVMTETESKALLAAFGINTPQSRIAATLPEAIRIAKEIKFPVALKIASPDITHKSDVNGVMLNVRDMQSLEKGFDEILTRVALARPGARLEGVTVQPMIEKRFGRELLVGVSRDPVFGQVISFGAGGVAVELLRDHAVVLPPLNSLLAEDVIDRTRISALLGGYRNVPAADRKDLVDTLLKVSEMVCALPWLEEMDINPLVVDDSGAVALDARVKIDVSRLEQDARFSHVAIRPYPADLTHVRELGNGHSLTIRAVTPEDAEMEKNFVANLSAETRRHRFFHDSRLLAPRLLARLTQIDYEREMALLAILNTSDGEQLVGVARYGPLSDGTGCEFAIVVDDAWHGKGLGKYLMTRLKEAATAAGYSRMVGLVRESNQKMHWLMRSLKAEPGGHGEDAETVVYRLHLKDSA